MVEKSWDEKISASQERLLLRLINVFLPKEDAVNTKYSDSLKKYLKEASYAQTTSDIVLLFRRMIEEDFDLMVLSNVDSQGFTFNVNEILIPPTRKAEALFT